MIIKKYYKKQSYQKILIRIDPCKGLVFYQVQYE